MNKQQVQLLNSNCTLSENFREFIHKIQQNQKRFQLYRRKDKVSNQQCIEFLKIFKQTLINQQQYQNQVKQDYSQTNQQASYSQSNQKGW
ncbi:unnamed protein product (macronuclear) [Paramecium tetraurelia]|uniref:Uncharacterized protein n=1 Tax=Paramecium tetraurelia TaxID=5888 RepID=A0CBL2_PARTE|nr:uncharacterized protein GSPATT00036962001 [Paramecium tetraurelia]CAK68179.1 unnamed protein product [Paramecium tetraurelia]|eukprot:XP_001435576.1 hypothetical protein (macronuclear) [Paramecium tetraurelia strain d4-2]